MGVEQWQISVMVVSTPSLALPVQRGGDIPSDVAFLQLNWNDVVSTLLNSKWNETVSK